MQNVKKIINAVRKFHAKHIRRPKNSSLFLNNVKTLATHIKANTRNTDITEVKFQKSEEKFIMQLYRFNMHLHQHSFFISTLC